MKSVRARQRLAALGVFAAVLLTFPVLGLPTGSILGLPASLLYLFVVWLVVIGMACRVAEKDEP